MEKFAVGVVLGTLCGALLVANNYKMRTLVKKGQAELAEKLDKLMDEKIEEVEEQTEKIKEEGPRSRRARCGPSENSSGHCGCS